MKIKIYQWTGYMCKSLIIEENKYILNNLDKWLAEYEKSPEKEWSFRTYVSIKIGMRQYKIGLYRGMYSLINPMFGYNRKWLKRQCEKLWEIYK